MISACPAALSEFEPLSAAGLAAMTTPPSTSLATATPRETVIDLCQLLAADVTEALAAMPDDSVDCVISSPPYNINKEYETRTSLETYLAFQESVISELYRVLGPDGQICWQVGNYVQTGEVIPLDSMMIPILRRAGFKIRGRIIWTFGHGLHGRRRLSGRHETIIWATKSDDYQFDLDAIRVPQKYPGKRYYKGPKKGQLSGHPLGKNPGDVWEIPNVKHNHPEKTSHPCQFPEEMINRLVAALSKPGDTILDPFAGSGTVGVVANRLRRASVLIERDLRYVDIAIERLRRNASMKPVADECGDKTSHSHHGARVMDA